MGELWAPGEAALLLFGALTVLWGVSLKLEDSSIVDIFWGLGFVAVGWTCLWRAPEVGPRGLLAVGLVTAWGLRLSGYLFVRNRRRPEDPRYAAMRRRHGAAWGSRSLFIVFWLQGALLFVVSLPVQAAVLLPGPAALGPLEILGAVVCLVGVGFESVGDLQLMRFKADPANRGQLMQRGLWRYTRHPNYFGDFLVWWGLYLVAVPTGLGALTVVGPGLMSFLLLKVSGVPMLEGAMKERPGYAEYHRRTSAFFPRRPKP